VAIVFTDAALEDLRRLGPPAARRAIERIAVLDAEPDVGESLATAETGYRKLSWRDGTWRVVYAADAGVVTVWEVWFDGVRTTGAAYAEALQRMVAADAPNAVELAGILERLGRITGTVPVPRNRVVEPVPDWLADALLERTSLTSLELASMDATTAFDAWNTLTRN
jgi:mRNA interferase RelE/StbE